MQRIGKYNRFKTAAFLLFFIVSGKLICQVGTLVGWGMSVCNTFSFKICPSQTIVPLNYGNQGWACNANISAPDISFNTMGSLWRIAKQNYTFTSNVNGQLTGYDPTGSPQTMTFSANQSITPMAYSVNGATTLVNFAINGSASSYTFNQSNFSISIAPVAFGSSSYTFCNNTSPNVTISPVIPPAGGPWSFTWQPGNISGNPAVVSPTVNTIYTVTAVTNGTTCSSTTTVAVTVTNCCGPMPDPGGVVGNTIICAGSTNVYSVAPIPGATSYSWTLPNGWTGTSTSNTISTVCSVGFGNVSVTGVNGCTVSGTAALIVQAVDCGGNTSINEKHETDGIVFFPNPSSGILNVTNNSSSQKKLQVSDLLGHLIMKDLSILPGSNGLELNLSPGTYIVSIIEENKKPENFKLIIR